MVNFILGVIAVKATNTTRNEIIAHNLECAETLLRRMIGLLGRASFEKGSGLLIRPCKGIHTFGMKFGIDVLFLDKTNKVVAIFEKFPPSRLTRIFGKAVTVIELPAGTVEITSTQIGDKIDVG